MEKSDFILKKLFAATTYVPFIEKIISLKDIDEELKEGYKLGLSGLNGLYEFKEAKGIKDQGEVNIDFLIDDPNYFKFGPERLEVQQVIDESNNYEKFIKRIYKLNKLHDDTFSNKPIKYGLVKIYDIENFIKVNNLFNIDAYEKESIDKCKNFILLKKDGFNINIEYTLSKDAVSLRIDINDKIVQNKYHNSSHYEDISKYHDIILSQELARINGVSNG